MARPKNITLLNGNTVLSVTPREFKSMLTQLAAGTTPSGGKELGTVKTNLSALSAEQAQAMLNELFPAPAPKPTPPSVVDAGVVVGAAPEVAATA